MSNRWAIWVDIEGFRKKYERHEDEDEKRDKKVPNPAINELCDLTEALFRIGDRVFSEHGERLFIHQFGDGFVVVSDFQEESPNRPIDICIALMRHLLSKGIVSKASISGGSWGVRCPKNFGQWTGGIMLLTARRSYYGTRPTL